MSAIRYVASGRLGDFIYQLSVIYEKFLTTGKKGILYISSTPESFAHGIEKAYADTKAYISTLEYIIEYKIHTGEAVDVNLSEWRYSPLLHKTHFNEIYKRTFSVDWASRPWLFSSVDDTLKDKVLVSCGATPRFPDKIDFTKLFEAYRKDKIIFITQNIEDFYYFFNRTKIDLPLLMPDTISDYIKAVNSCSLFIGSLSSPLTYAYGLHKNSITLLSSQSESDNIHVIGLKNTIPRNTCIYTNIEDPKEVEKNETIAGSTISPPIIPPNLFHYWDGEVPDAMQKAIEQTTPKGFTHYVHNNASARECIKENFDARILSAYDSLIPQSYKSDLWRLCVLYTYGGIYIDTKYVPVNGFSLDSLRERERFVRGTNSLIVCKPGNDTLRKSIDTIVEHCRTRYYGNTPKCPTGLLIDAEYIDLSLLDDTILMNGRPILQEYADYSLDRELYGSSRSSELWREKRIYIPAEQPHLYFIVTTSLFNDSTLRKEQYTRGITTLREVLSRSKLTNYTIVIVENNGKRETFLDTLGCKVYYTNNNSLQEFDKGYRELQDIFDTIKEFNIKDSDFVIKMTGRYIINEDSEFIKALETLDLSDCDCIIKFGSYMNLGRYNPVDDISMGDCITGLTAMKSGHVKQVEYPVGYDIVEWNWAKVAKSIHEFKVCKLQKLGISICPSGDMYFQV